MGGDLGGRMSGSGISGIFGSSFLGCQSDAGSARTNRRRPPPSSRRVAEDDALIACNRAGDDELRY